MMENILLAIIMPLVNAEEYFVAYSPVSKECCILFCWLLSCRYSKLENIWLAIVLLLVNAGEYFVGYYHAIN